MPRGLAAEHTRPIGWAGSISVVGRVDRLLAGKDAGLVQSRCLRAAHLSSAPAPPQLLSSSSVQGMGSGKGGYLAQHDFDEVTDGVGGIFGPPRTFQPAID